MPTKDRSIHIWLHRAIALVLTALLAACGGGSQPTASLQPERLSANRARGRGR